MRSWQVLEQVVTPEGALELRSRGDGDFLITVAGRVLMNSSAHRSEAALAECGCGAIAGRAAPRVLLGGLGMGLTLRAALDALPPRARVTVAELHGAVVAWCRGPLAALTEHAVDDPRVEIVLRDVARVIADARGERRFDAILLDLYAGPAGAADADSPFYGTRALAVTRAALAPGGVFGVWAERPDVAFEKRLRVAGYEVEKRRPGRGGLRHVVYIARPPAAASVSARMPRP
jgi:spermidine synthase